MKRRWILLIIAIFTLFVVFELTSNADEDSSLVEQNFQGNIVECALSRHAKAVDFLAVISQLCDRMCTIPSKPFFCDRKSFLEKHGNPRYDFSQFPSDKYDSNIERVDVIYSAIGERFYGPGGQSYVLESIRQWRIFHSSSESRVFLVVDDDRMNDSKVVEYQSQFDIIMIPKSNLTNPRMERYRSNFYIQGYMHPGGNRSTGNKQFNQLVTERFFLAAAIIRQFHLRHVLHLENDNLIYTNMKRIVKAIARCGYGIASTAPTVEGFVPGVVYIRDADSIEFFLDYVNDFLSCGKSFGVAVGRRITRKKDPYANDMTYLMNFYQLYGSSHVGELPAWIHVDGENCIVESSKQLGLPPYLFDSASFGQWYSFATLGGSSTPPHKIQVAAKKRFLDITPPPWLTWIEEDGNKVPVWKGFRIISLHIHAKNLQHFLSR